MACSSVNRTDRVETNGKSTNAMKKQQLMSNYRLIVVSSTAPVLLCSEQLQNNRHLCKSVFTFLLLDAIQDVVATLFDECERVVSSSCRAVLHDCSVD